jgi:hypothetical protein
MFKKFKKIGFIPANNLETGNELTKLLAKEDDFIWKCNHNFGKLDYKTVNFRNQGDESFLQIDDDTKIFVRFFTPTTKNMDSNWFNKVSSIGLSFVFKEHPVLQIDTNSFNNIRSITLSVSNTILHFMDNEFDICGQFGYENGDRNFYFKRYNEGSENIFLSHDDLLKVVKKCLNILHNVYDDNKNVFEVKNDIKKIAEKEYNVNLNNIADFIQEM